MKSNSHILSLMCAAAHETTERPDSDVVDTLETVPEAVPVTLTEPPIEEQLAWHTLWPETHKLYGHGNELFSLCCDHEGKLVASSCKVCNFTYQLWLLGHVLCSAGHVLLCIIDTKINSTSL